MRRCGERDEEMWGERLSKRWKKMEQKRWRELAKGKGEKYRQRWRDL